MKDAKKIYIRERTTSPTNGLAKPECQYEGMKLDPYFLLCTQNSKWINNLNRPDALKMLKEKGARTLQQVGTGGTGSLNRIPVTRNMTNDLDKEFHDIQKLLYNEENCQVSEKAVIRMGEKSFLALHTTED